MPLEETVVEPVHQCRSHRSEEIVRAVCSHWIEPLMGSNQQSGGSARFLCAYAQRAFDRRRNLFPEAWRGDGVAVRQELMRIMTEGGAAWGQALKKSLAMLMALMMVARLVMLMISTVLLSPMLQEPQRATVSCGGQ